MSQLSRWGKPKGDWGRTPALAHKGKIPEVSTHRKESNVEAWKLEARCAKAPPRLFFDRDFAKAAGFWCSACQVQSQCLEYALRERLTGFFGGMWCEDARPLRQALKTPLRGLKGEPEWTETNWEL